jgi:protein SCO1
MTRIYAISAAALVAALLGAMGYLALTGARSGDDRFAQCRATQISGGAGALGGPFELVNAEGRTVTDAEVITEPTLLYFGYTFCPDVCPLDSARNAQAIDVLQERGIGAQSVFVSVDPARDTPEVMGDFASYIHPRMIGLTGSDAQVRQAAQAYRAYFNRHEDPDDPYYLVDHSTFTYLVLPGHGFVEFFRREDTAEQIATTAACFVDAAG